MNRIYNVINGVCIRNDERNNEINQRMFQRNTTDKPLEPNISVRATPTKYVRMPIVNVRKPANEPLALYNIYDNKKQFYPGDSKAPWSGFADNVDTETQLRNTMFALQKCDQREYVPSTNSNMYSYPLQQLPPPFQHGLLFSVPEVQNNRPDFNDNEVFNNSTRYQRNDFKNKKNKC